MPALAITGLIGSGKSTALNLITGSFEKTSAKIISFSADSENSRLLEHDPVVKRLILKQFGDSCYLDNGKPDRARLFELISGDATAKKSLEEILHPRIEQRWKPLAEKHRGKRGEFFVAEIPLLYEKGLECFFDRTVVVGCSDSVRRERLQRERSLSSEETSRWMRMQHSQHEKTSKADHLLWNDGSSESLDLQIRKLLAILRSA